MTKDSLFVRLTAAMADALDPNAPSAPGLVLTVAIEPSTVQAGQALRLWQVEPAVLARWLALWLEPAIAQSLTDLAAQHGARAAALAWSVTVQL